MATLCRSEVAVPGNIVAREETLKLAERLHAGNSQLNLVLRLIASTGVQGRHIVQPLEQTIKHPSFEFRNRIYEREAKRRIPPVIQQALTHPASAPQKAAQHGADGLASPHDQG